MGKLVVCGLLPMMKQLVDMRELYDLHMVVERYINAEPSEDEKFIRK